MPSRALAASAASGFAMACSCSGALVAGLLIVRSGALILSQERKLGHLYAQVCSVRKGKDRSALRDNRTRSPSPPLLAPVSTFTQGSECTGAAEAMQPARNVRLGSRNACLHRYHLLDRPNGCMPEEPMDLEC